MYPKENQFSVWEKITNFKEEKFHWLISRCRKSLKSTSVKWIISIFAAMWSQRVERSPTGNLTNGRLITIICRGGFRVYFHICQQNKLLLLLLWWSFLRLLSFARSIRVDWFSFHLIRHHPVKTNIFWASSSPEIQEQNWISQYFETLTFSHIFF